MCYHNFTLHNGCGHKTPFPGARQYTLCETARRSLPGAEAKVRSPDLPPPPPPPKDAIVPNSSVRSKKAIAFSAQNATLDKVAQQPTITAVPRGASVDIPRSSTTSFTTTPADRRASVQEKRSSRLGRFGSQYMKRMPTWVHNKSQSISGRVGGGGGAGAGHAAGPGGVSNSNRDEKNYSSGAGGMAVPQDPPASPFDEYAGASPLDLAVALCEGDDLKVALHREERVDVCERCKRIVNEMRWLVQAYDEKRIIKGCRAYWYVDIPRDEDRVNTTKWVVRREDTTAMR